MHSDGAMIEVQDDELEDLRSRLRRTRWPASWPTSRREHVTGWETGVDAHELARLVQYWGSGFTWRVQEAAINALPWHVADLGGAAVSYLRFDGEHPDALPIVLTHGWPSSFLELTELARRLAAPSRYGGSVGDAFTVVVPALPGYPFTPQAASLPPDVQTHELWHQLMHDELGFARYAAHGGDLGAGVTSLLGQAHPEALVGIHVLAVAQPVDVDSDTVTTAEQEYLDSLSAWSVEEGGYEHQQATRPATLSYGLADSPVGLLAWIVEKYRSWSDGERLSSRFSDDFVLTQASLYWFTNTISTSFRPYYEFAHGMRDRVTSVTVPTALAVFPKDLSQPPRSWAERTYNLTRYTRMPRGGHFAAHEEPDLLADDLRAFFTALR